MFRRDTLIVIGQLFIILVLALLFSNTSLSPLNNNGIEGFHEMTPNRLEYTAVGQPDNALDDIYAVRTINPDSSQCKKVSGFPGYGVFCTPNSQSEKLDIYSEAKGDLNCENLGLYNSRGPLCLDDNMKRMLQTRGANAQGGFGQIGSA
jgi:hypothetical protein